MLLTLYGSIFPLSNMHVLQKNPILIFLFKYFMKILFFEF